MTLKDIRAKVEAAKGLGSKTVEIEFDSTTPLTAEMKVNGFWVEGFGTGKVLWQADHQNGTYTIRAKFRVAKLEKSLAEAQA